MHHTKYKADIGLANVISNLTEKGHVPCIPLSEHQAYDLVVILSDRTAIKLQVKYATLRNNGTVEVRFRRNWSDKKGVHSENYAAWEFDYYAVYCPEKNTVLYIPNNSDCPKVIRFEKPGNNQEESVKWANNYLEIKRESSETIRRTPEMVKT